MSKCHSGFPWKSNSQEWCKPLGELQDGPRKVSRSFLLIWQRVEKGGGAVTEWSRALQLREKINANQKIPGLLPRPGQPRIGKIILDKGLTDMPSIEWYPPNLFIMWQSLLWSDKTMAQISLVCLKVRDSSSDGMNSCHKKMLTAEGIWVGLVTYCQEWKQLELVVYPTNRCQ